MYKIILKGFFLHKNDTSIFLWEKVNQAQLLEHFFQSVNYNYVNEDWSVK